MDLTKYSSEQEKINALIDYLKNYKVGTFIKIKYFSEYDYKGQHLKKTTDTVVRLGISYENNFKKEGTKEIANNCFYVIPDMLKYNAKTNNYLFLCYTTRNDTTIRHCIYELNYKETDKDTFLKYARPSYKNDSDIILYTIKLQNLLSIGE